MSGPTSQTTTPTETIPSRGGGHTGAYVAIAVVIVIVIVIAGLYFAGVLFPKPGKSGGTCASTTLLGAGSTFVDPLMTTWASHYSTNSVNYQSVGSGAGISELTAKTVDFGASDAPLNTSQRAALPGVLEIPEAAGAVAIIYNIPGVSSLQLTGATLAKIYMGTVTKWNDPAITASNPGVSLPAATIAVVHRSDGSGTTFALTDFFSHDSPAWASSIGKTLGPLSFGIGAKGSSAVAGTVSTTPDSVGYVDLVYASNAHLTAAKIQNPSGTYVAPTLADTQSAVADAAPTANAGGALPAGSQSWYNVSLINAKGSGDYPIATFTYVMVYQALDTAYAGTGNTFTKAKAEDLSNWLTWMVTQGQSFSPGLFYVPLPTAVASIDQTTIGSMTFGGSAIPGCT